MIQFDSFKGKNIAISGASRGIGRETSKLLGSLGANLILGSRNEAELKEVAVQVEQAGGHALPVHLDVTDEISVRDFSDAARREFGRVDTLINSAGTGRFSSVLDLSSEDFDQMISVNLKGTFLCCKYFGKQMVKQGFGHILNIVSIAGVVALPGGGGYSASKFGILGLSRVLQTELRSQGVQVTSVLPGAVNSTFWADIDPKPDLSSMIPLATLARHIVYLLSSHDGAFVDEMTIMPPLGIL
ncbi:SDR family oxidoreductase [Alicyclobacillus fastidiosus]|uniref:SDR family oxidoreductase n=1 Tax=Alicyclobacillus fastidiosus TaxID=392011 RepID=A0ABV5AIF9_9BACL|nr:SDR family oxidoreductase [Alicyclobacillus fastidiosus]WEH10100.1 SDR family NAD(P)-dependent oxidoreductase [Alicyclobacillus fastidiosus]